MKQKLYDTKKMKLQIDLLNVDRYQKRIRERVVKKIVDNFNPAAVGVIHVSHREDGTFWIFDGQHRVEAMKRLGYTVVDCLVFSGLTYQEESKALVSHHDVSKPTKIEEHHAKVEAEEKTSLEIESILDDLNIKVRQGSGYGSIQAVGTVYEIYKKGGGQDLRKVLGILIETFGNKSEVFLRNTMLGLQKFINQYRDEYDEKWLVKKLKTIDYSELMNKADVYKRVNGFNKTDAVKMVITERYNHNKSKHLRLK